MHYPCAISVYSVGYDADVADLIEISLTLYNDWATAGRLVAHLANCTVHVNSTLFDDTATDVANLLATVASLEQSVMSGLKKLDAAMRFTEIVDLWYSPTILLNHNTNVSLITAVRALSTTIHQRSLQKSGDLCESPLAVYVRNRAYSFFSIFFGVESQLQHSIFAFRNLVTPPSRTDPLAALVALLGALFIFFVWQFLAWRSLIGTLRSNFDVDEAPMEVSGIEEPFRCGQFLRPAALLVFVSLLFYVFSLLMWHLIAENQLKFVDSINGLLSIHNLSLITSSAWSSEMCGWMFGNDNQIQPQIF
jgi:hypothetical protein